MLTRSDRDSLARDGYVVLSGLLPDRLLNAARDAICSFVNADLDRPETWYGHEPLVWSVVPVHHAQAFWDIRQWPAVHDREFPEAARMLMLNGAELILTPNACDLDDRKSGVGDVRIAQFRSRAFENLVAVAMANYAAPQCDGRSVAFDPDGTLVVQADSTERIVLAEFDLERLREYRKREAGRDAARSPEKYAAITSTEHARPLGSRPA